MLPLNASRLEDYIPLQSAESTMKKAAMANTQLKLATPGDHGGTENPAGSSRAVLVEQVSLTSLEGAQSPLPALREHQKALGGDFKDVAQS